MLLILVEHNRIKMNIIRFIITKLYSTEICKQK